MRIAMNTLMINKWRALGSYQSRYVPGMIGPFLKVSLVPHTSKISYDAVSTVEVSSNCGHSTVCSAVDSGAEVMVV